MLADYAMSFWRPTPPKRQYEKTTERQDAKTTFLLEKTTTWTRQNDNTDKMHMTYVEWPGEMIFISVTAIISFQ